MNDWLHIVTQEYLNVDGAVDVANILSKQVLLVSLESQYKKQTWNKAGAFVQLLDLEPVTDKVEVTDSYSRVGFGNSLLKFQILSGNNYQLRFKPVPWLHCFTISIWEYLGD